MYRSILFIDMLLLIIMLGGSRLVWRLAQERTLENNVMETTGNNKVLILGAGYTGAHLLKHLRRFSSDYSVSGFIDKDPRKLNSNITANIEIYIKDWRINCSQ